MSVSSFGFGKKIKRIHQDMHKQNCTIQMHSHAGTHTDKHIPVAHVMDTMMMDEARWSFPHVTLEA